MPDGQTTRDPEVIGLLFVISWQYWGTIGLIVDTGTQLTHLPLEKIAAIAIRRQTIILSSDGLVYWRIQTSLRPNALNCHHCRRMYTRSRRCFREEVFPWFFYICASISRAVDLSHEIVSWLGSR